MAVALLGGTEVGVREIGTTVSIPPNPTARLMFYLDCVCCLLDLDAEGNIARLRNYAGYFRLSEEEIDKLVSLCFLFSPDKLLNKVIIQNDGLCGNSNNQFLELNAVQSNMILSEGIIIAGQKRTVRKIMACKMVWLEANWFEPMRYFTGRLERIAAGLPPPPSRPAIEYRPRPVAPTNPTITYTRPNRPRQVAPTYQKTTYNRPYRPASPLRTSHSSCCTIL